MIARAWYVQCDVCERADKALEVYAVEVETVVREMRESARKTRSRHRARKLKGWADRLAATRNREEEGVRGEG